MQKVLPDVKNDNLYNVMGKNGITSLKEVLQLEEEFKCYLRPVIEDDQNGWGFLAYNLSIPKSSIY